MSAKHPSRSRRPGGRVTPKGVRPPGTATRDGHGARPDAVGGHAAMRDARPVPDRRSVARPPAVRSGHRGDR